MEKLQKEKDGYKKGFDYLMELYKDDDFEWNPLKCIDSDNINLFAEAILITEGLYYRLPESAKTDQLYKKVLEQDYKYTRYFPNRIMDRVFNEEELISLVKKDINYMRYIFYPTEKIYMTALEKDCTWYKNIPKESKTDTIKKKYIEEVTKKTMAE